MLSVFSYILNFFELHCNNRFFIIGRSNTWNPNRSNYSTNLTEISRINEYRFLLDWIIFTLIFLIIFLFSFSIAMELLIYLLWFLWNLFVYAHYSIHPWLLLLLNNKFYSCSLLITISILLKMIVKADIAWRHSRLVLRSQIVLQRGTQLTAGYRLVIGVGLHLHCVQHGNAGIGWFVLLILLWNEILHEVVVEDDNVEDDLCGVGQDEPQVKDLFFLGQ